MAAVSFLLLSIVASTFAGLKYSLLLILQHANSSAHQMGGSTVGMEALKIGDHHTISAPIEACAHDVPGQCALGNALRSVLMTFAVENIQME